MNESEYPSADQSNAVERVPKIPTASECHPNEISANPIDADGSYLNRGQPIDAELIGTSNHTWSEPAAGRRRLIFRRTTDAQQFQNLAANGGVVGAIVLGVWTIVGSFITPLAAINGFLGLILGFWGMTSRLRQWALFGMLLSAVGILLCIFDICRPLS